MDGPQHRHAWNERCQNFAEVTELVANRMVEVGRAGGRVLSVSHAVDPSDSEGLYSVVIIAEAPEVVETGADAAAGIIESQDQPRDLRPLSELIAELKERGVKVSIESEET